MSKPRYTHGDVRDDGYTFWGYSKAGGKGHDLWYSPKAMFRHRIGKTLLHAKKRAKAKDLPFDLDIDYLLSIYPKDNLCPVFGFELSFGYKDGVFNSPSLDRIIPALGYTKGNVIFVSHKANCIKSNASPEEIIRVGEFYQRLEDPD